MKADGTPETEFEEAMPLFGAIIGKMSADAAWTQNQLTAIMERNMYQLQKDFTMLYASLEKVAERTDSSTAYNALDRFYHINNEAHRGMKEFKGFKEGY